MAAATPAPSGASAAPAGPPPWTDVGGLTGIAPGTSANLEVDLPRPRARDARAVVELRERALEVLGAP